MEESQKHEQGAERYLLGEMSEQEQAQFEESYFADDELFERFLAAKDDLIDAYARGDLTGPKRERFEQYFLATEPRRQRVEEARGFIRAVTAASMNTATVDSANATKTVAATSWWQSTLRLFAGRPLVWQGTLAVLLLVAITGSLVLVRQFQSRRTARERAQNEEAARRKQEEERGRAVVAPGNSNGLPLKPTASPKQPPRVEPEQHALVASLVLTPFSPRYATVANSLLLRPDTTGVRLQLAFTADDYKRYDVALRTLDGERALTRQGLKARSSTSGKSVTIMLDPSIFSHQDYIVTLSGLTPAGKLEPIADYYFRVQRSTSH